MQTLRALAITTWFMSWVALVGFVTLFGW